MSDLSSYATPAASSATREAHALTHAFASQVVALLASVQYNGLSSATPALMAPVWECALDVQTKWITAGLPALGSPSPAISSPSLSQGSQCNLLDLMWAIRGIDPDSFRWNVPMEWAVHAGWSPWSVGLNGESSILRLLDAGPNMDVEVCRLLDRQGINWERRVGEPDGLVLQADRISPVFPSDTLFTQAVFHWQFPAEEMLAPLMAFWVERFTDPWEVIAGPLSLVDMCPVATRPHLVAMLNQRHFREMAEHRSETAHRDDAIFVDRPARARVRP